MNSPELYYLWNRKYSLIHKSYDDELFGTKVYELIEDGKNDSVVNHVSELERLKNDLKTIDFCTFRGKYCFEMTCFLEVNGFRYIDDYLSMKVQREQFRPIFPNDRFSVKVILGEPTNEIQNQILTIESTVYDYSSFQADRRIDNEISSRRNCQRVKSHFKKKDHVIFYVVDPQNIEKVVGFFQFVIQGNVAEGMNGAIMEGYQNNFLGPALYSFSCRYIFDYYATVNVIDIGLGFNNNRVYRIFDKLKFSFVSREIHFRKISNNILSIIGNKS